MQLRTVFVLVCVFSLLLLSFTEAKGKKDRGSKGKKEKGKRKGGKGGKAKHTCDDSDRTKHTHLVDASELQKGLKFKCKRKGVITDLNLVGINGTKCEGITPDLFVQIADCMWKTECKVTYDPDKVNYMIKLFKGEPSCVVNSPDSFRYNYSCSHRIREDDLIDLSAGTQQKEDAQGIVRSHPTQPWMYERHTADQKLSLHNKGKGPSNLYYTFRSLHLSHNDEVWVEGGGGKTNYTHYNTSFPGDDAGSLRSGVIKNVDDVTVTLKVQYTSAGGDGFVLCFQWKEEVKKVFDVCEDGNLIKPQICKVKGGKRQKKNAS